MWVVEEIPNQDKLFYRIHKNSYKKGKLLPGIFREIVDGMSTDWEKYSTPVDSVNRARASNPRDNGILGLNTGEVREIGLTVIHNPSKDNRSHTLVRGTSKKIQDDPDVRRRLLGISEILILPENL